LSSKAAAPLLAWALALQAQPAGGQEPADPYGPPPPMEDCSAEQEAAIISGEIIVCRRKADQSQYRMSSDDDAADRYARETMDQDAPRAPDVAGEGIFKGPATVSGLCLIGPCPPPPAYMVDFAALPETPAGSDAERVGQGLAPKGEAAAAAAAAADEAG